MNNLFQAPTPIFFDPKGNRWKFFISLTLLIVVCTSFIGYFFYRTQLTLFSIDQNYRSLNYDPFAFGRTIQKKSLLAFLDNEYESYYSLKENITNTAGVVLPWVSFTQDGLIATQDSDLKNLQQEFIKKLRPTPNTFLQISDYDYNLQTPAKSNFLKFLDTYNAESIKQLGDYIIGSNNFRGVVFNIDTSNWLSENITKYLGFRSSLGDYIKDKKLVTFDSLFLNTQPQVIEQLKGRQNYFIVNYWNNVYDVNEPIVNYNTNPQELKSVISAIGSNNYYINFPTFSKDIRFTNEGVVNYEQKLSFSKIYDIMKEFKPEIKTDEKSQSSFFDYTDKEGISHKVWIADGISLFNQQFQISNTLDVDKFEGYAFSNIGFEEQSMWDVIKAETFADKKTTIEDKFKVDNLVDNEGKGVVSKIISNAEFGTRTTELKDGLITKQTWGKLPLRSKIQKIGFQEKTLALTFDDGPDPVYTPKILDILKKYNVKATFFIIGKQVTQYPEIAKRIITEGHTIANHTYSHPRLNNLQSLTIDNEISNTDDILSELLNIKTDYFRTPYNDIFGFNTESDLVVIKEVDKYNKYIVEDDIDSKDWLLKDKEGITKRVFDTIDTSQGSVILFHDAGGNRESTVAALPGIIEGISKRGYSIKSLNETVGLDSLNNKSAQNAQFVQQQFSLSVSDILIRLFSSILIFASIVGVFRYFVLSGLLARLHLRRKKLSYNYHFTPGVSIVVPCYNEEVVIKRTISSLLKSTYSNIEVVVVDDGSTDNSLKTIKNSFGTNSKVTIYNKVNQGKSIALNYGIRKAKYEYVICVDADTIFHPNGVRELMKHFENPEVGGVAGNVQIGNATSNLTKAQQLEYSVSQNFDKESYASVNSVIVVPGPIGAWRKPVLLGAGGLHADNLAEDTDLTLRVLQQGWKIVYEPNALCYTESPETYPAFVRQRNRWQFGVLQVLFKNWTMVFNPEYKFIGMFTLPLMLIHYMLLIIYPLMILSLFSYIGYYLAESYSGGLGLSVRLFFDNKLFIYFTLAYFVLDMIKIIITLMKEKYVESKWKLLLTLPYYLFIYQNLMAMIAFYAVIRAIRGKIVGWGHLNRTGSVSVKPLQGRNI
jgi:peptidoglycan-N-acetylglucosamine deacetylase